MSLFGNKEIKELQVQVAKLSEKRDIWTTFPMGTMGIPYTSSFEIKKNLTLSAVFCAVNKISDSIATLDLKPFKRDLRGFRTENYDSPLYNLLTIQPSPSVGKYMFWKVGMLDMLNNGNMYAWIERDIDFNPVALHLLPPNCVSKKMINGQRKWVVSGINGSANVNGTINNIVNIPTGLIDDANMLHIINFPDPDDQDLGISTIQYARNSLELVYNAEVHSSEFLKNGSNMNAYIQAEGNPPEPMITAMQNRLRNSYDATNRTKDIPVIPMGMTMHTLSISPKDAQLIESRQWNITEISRWYSIHPALLFDNQKQLGNTIEAMQIEYLNTTLQPLLSKIISEFTMKLILPKDRRTFTLEFDTVKLIQMDSVATATYYEKMVTNGFMSINDVRQKIGGTYAEGGDDVFMPVQVQSLAHPVVIDNKNVTDNNLK